MTAALVVLLILGLVLGSVGGYLVRHHRVRLRADAALTSADSGTRAEVSTVKTVDTRHRWRTAPVGTRPLPTRR